MPDFFKKMKKKVDKKKMSGGDKTTNKERLQRRLKMLPLHASTTSLFCRQRKGQASETHGKYLTYTQTQSWGLKLSTGD